MADNDWISAMQRLVTGGLPQDTALTSDPGGPFGALYSRTERAKRGGAEALPLGDIADPVSQIAMILSPFLSQYRGMQASSPALGIPARRTLPTPGLPSPMRPRYAPEEIARLNRIMNEDPTPEAIEAALSRLRPAPAPQDPIARLQALRTGGLPGTQLTTPRSSAQLYRADRNQRTLFPRESIATRTSPVTTDLPPNMPDTSGTGLLHSGIRERLAHLRSQGLDTSGFERIYSDIQHAAATMENYGEFQELTELHRQLSRAMAGAYRSGSSTR